MSQTIQIKNFGSLNIIERSKLNADAAVAATTLSVHFSDNLAVGDYLYMGTLGSEGGEVVTVSSITDADTVVVSATTKPHSRFDAVTKLFGNQIKVYRAANSDGTIPDDGDFAIVGAAFDIDYDQVQTSFTDENGSSGYWYKFAYYNEAEDLETSLADSKAVRGGGTTDYTSIESIRRKAGLLENTWISDSDIDEKRQVAQSLINAKLTGLYSVPFTAPINPTIAEITRLLAAGYLLTDDYGPLNKLNTSEGQQMIDRANDYLTKLNTKDIELTDVSGNSTAITTNSGFQMWPNADTATTASTSGGGARMFRVSDRY